ncbi:sensor histidine kinase [Flavobacterium sp. FlaQc-52]|uniref:sensor histidine kinase n=1 Tax=Flavobacterium sp. FlaQc-52 TaxID=3374185 RepID=UPI0037566133
MFTIKRISLLFWIFLFLVIFLQLMLSGIPKFSFPCAFLTAGCNVLTLRLHVCFLNVFIRKYMETHDTGKFVFSVLFISSITAFFITIECYLIIRFMMPEAVYTKNDMISMFFGTFMASILVSGMCYSIEMFRKNVVAEKRHQELRNSVLEMEIDHLRTQLSPHFTFNILNNLQFLIRKDQDEALELLSAYSKILRYYVYESQNKWIRLDSEITFLKHYFELEKGRSEEDLEISCQWDIPENTLLVIPFLLSTFVENAFKHVSSFSEKKNYIELHVFLKEGNQLFLKIKNSFDSEVLNRKKAGVGLTYAKKRLELSYKDNYDLEFVSEADSYSVSLKLNLTNE